MTRGTKPRLLLTGCAMLLAALPLSTPSTSLERFPIERNRSIDQNSLKRNNARALSDPIGSDNALDKKNGDATSSESTCKREAPTVANGKSVYDLDQTWSGVRTSIGSTVRARGTILLAYYDADKWVTVAEFDPKTGVFCKKRLDSRFSGWDSHNFLTISESRDGIIHLAGNVHAEPLFYAQSSDKNFSSIKITKMIGREEKKVTYPKFISASDGRYFFIYREGGSGFGSWLVNEWRSGAWKRVGPIFDDHDGKENVSAYPSSFVVGPDGAFHVAVVWRKNPDVKSNYALTYASTKDFVNWSVEDAVDIKSPMRRASMELVSQVGEDHGLVNGIALCLGQSGSPIVIYSKYGADETNSVFVAMRATTGWSESEVARSKSRFEISGKGTLPGLPIVSVAERNGEIVGRVKFRSEKMREFVVDAGSIGGTSSENSAPDDYKIDKKLYEGLDGVQVRTAIVSSKENENPVTARLMWFAQGPHQDRQRECTEAAPRACNPPPSPLMLIVN